METTPKIRSGGPGSCAIHERSQALAKKCGHLTLVDPKRETSAAPAPLIERFEAACDRLKLGPEAAELANQIVSYVKMRERGPLPAPLRIGCLAAIDQFEARLLSGLSTTAIDIAGGRQSPDPESGRC